MQSEIAAIVGIESFRNPEDDPPRFGLSPDHLSQGQRGFAPLMGCLTRKKEAGDVAAVVIDDDGQPGAGDTTISAFGPEIELVMIRLPTLLGMLLRNDESRRTLRGRLYRRREPRS